MANDFAADLDAVEKDIAQTAPFRAPVIVARDRGVAVGPDDAEAVEGQRRQPGDQCVGLHAAVQSAYH